MRKFLIILIAVAVAGCDRPKTIPREELKEIFKEAFLVNAYYDTHPLMTDDSLDIYGPVLRRWGYDVRDLEHTVQNFSRKKSAKLSDVVVDAIDELTAQAAYYDERVAVIDSIDAVAGRMFRREVLWRDSILVTRIADTARLRISLPVEAGDYEVSYKYFIDSLEENRNLRTTMWLVDTLGILNLKNTNFMTAHLRLGNEQRITATGADSLLEVRFGGYYPRNMKRPHIRIDSLRITYYLPRREALDSLSTLWNQTFVPHAAPQDSSAHGAVATGSDTIAAPDARR